MVAGLFISFRSQRLGRRSCEELGNPRLHENGYGGPQSRSRSRRPKIPGRIHLRGPSGFDTLVDKVRETNAEATFRNGLAVYQLTGTGLMLQADIAGTKYWKNRKLNRG